MASLITGKTNSQGNSGTSAGRLGSEVLIGSASLAAVASWTSPTWNAGAYRRLRFVINLTTGQNTTFTLTGISTNWTSRSVYGSAGSAAANNSASTAGATLNDFGADFALVEGSVNIVTGVPRFGFTNVFGLVGATSANKVWAYTNADTSSGVTGFALQFAGNATGTVELWGVPS